MVTEIQLFRESIEEADQILIGIGEEFAVTKQELAEFEVFQTYQKKREDESNAQTAWLEEYVKAYYSWHVENCRLLVAYQNLYEMIKDKNYFIVTLNADSFLTRTGISQDQVVSPCGSYQRLQCSNGCKEVWDSKDTISAVVDAIMEDGKALTEIQKPRCKTCMEFAEFNIVGTKSYVEEGYLGQWQKYTNWLSHTLNKKLCVLELGVGFQYPSVIRWPFEKAAFFNQKSGFIRVNGKFAQLSKEFASKEKVTVIHDNALHFLCH